MLYFLLFVNDVYLYLALLIGLVMYLFDLVAMVGRDSLGLLFIWFTIL